MLLKLSTSTRGRKRRDLGRIKKYLEIYPMITAWDDFETMKNTNPNSNLKRNVISDNTFISISNRKNSKIIFL
jgi:hypothetical protein